MLCDRINITLIPFMSLIYNTKKFVSHDVNIKHIHKLR